MGSPAKKKIVVSVFAAVLVVIGTIYVLLRVLPVSEDFVKQEIEKANYCTVKEDCVEAQSSCPFGCYVLVNKDEMKRINRLIQRYRDTSTELCDYMCLSWQGYDCVSNRCQPLRE